MPQDIQQRRKAELSRLSTPQLLLWAQGEDCSPEDRDVVTALLVERSRNGEQIPAASSTAANGERHPGNPSVGKEAVAAFRQNLPRLLQERAGQWVAYHGSQLIGFASTDIELHRECRKQNIPASEYIVRPIEPNPPETISFLDLPMA
jgi:hypothetical protein